MTTNDATPREADRAVRESDADAVGYKAHSIAELRDIIVRAHGMATGSYVQDDTEMRRRIGKLLDKAIDEDDVMRGFLGRGGPLAHLDMLTGSGSLAAAAGPTGDDADLTTACMAGYQAGKDAAAVEPEPGLSLETMKRINRLIRAIEGKEAILRAYRMGGYRSPSQKAFADADCLQDGDRDNFTKEQMAAVRRATGAEGVMTEKQERYLS